MTVVAVPEAELPPPAGPTKARSPLRSLIRLLRQSAPGKAGLAILGVFTAMAIFAPALAPYDPDARVAPSFTSPNRDHLLGTNDIGQDILSELFFGARVSLGVALLVATVAIVIATLVGVVSGYFGGWVSSAAMRFVDMVLVLPFLPLMLVVAAIFGPGIWTQVLVIGLLLWARPARVIRAAVLSVRTAGHIEAATWMGASRPYILRRHVLPRITPILVAEFVRAANIAILLEAALAFLGLGDPVIKSWGTMLHYAQVKSAFITGAWYWWILPASLCIALVVLGFALVGFALEQGTDPRLRMRGWLGTS